MHTVVKFLAYLPMGVVVLGSDDGVRLWNQQAEALLGTVHQGLTTTDLIERFPPEERPSLHLLLAAAPAAGTSGMVCARPAADGAPNYLEITVAGLTQPGDGPMRLVTLQDVTARERAEREAAAAQRRTAEAHALLDTLLTNAPIGLGFIDTELRYVRVNKALAAMNGPSVDEHLGRRVRDMLPYWGDEVEHVLRSVLTTRQPVVNLEAGGITESGQERHWLGNFYPVFAGDATLLGVGAVVNELTERVRMEQAVRASEARLAGQKQILEEIAAGAPLHRVLTLLALLVEGYGEHARCAITLVELDGETVRALIAPSFDPGVTQLRQWTAVEAWTLRDGWHLGFTAPIRAAEGSALGRLQVFYPQPHAPGPQATAFFQAAVELAKIAIERKRLEEGNSRQLQSLIENMADGVLAVDEQARLTVVNPAARRMLDAARLTQERVRLDSVGLPTDLTQALHLALTGQHAQPQRLRFRSGETEVAAFVSPVGTDLGTHGAIALLHDVTAQVRYTRLQESFVANVSHELRGPLASVSATLEAIAEGVIPVAEQPRYFRALLAEMGRLRRLSYDVVDLSRLDTGAATLHFSAFDIGHMLRGLKDQWHQRLSNQGLTLQVQPVRQRVWADYDRVEQVVINLLDNAARFTPPGGLITLAAHAAQGRVHVHVRDTGMGIAAEHLPQIWTRFYKVDAVRPREVNSGTGLGLSLVKQLVELMGGQVAVSSTPGQGSDFAFTLPLAATVRRRRKSAAQAARPTTDPT